VNFALTASPKSLRRLSIVPTISRAAGSAQMASFADRHGESIAQKMREACVLVLTRMIANVSRDVA
jgi:hypothetical protein